MRDDSRSQIIEKARQYLITAVRFLSFASPVRRFGIMAASCELQVNAIFSKGSFLCGLPKLTVAPAKFCVLLYNTFDPCALLPIWVMLV
jgi:hypothetical protein